MDRFFNCQTIISLLFAAGLGAYTIGLNPQLNHWVLGCLIFAFTFITTLALYCTSACIGSKVAGFVVTFFAGALLSVIVSDTSISFNDAIRLGLTGVYIEDCSSAEKEEHPGECGKRHLLKHNRDLAMHYSKTDKKTLERSENAIKFAQTIETAGTAAIGTSAFWLYIIVELTSCLFAFLACYISGLKPRD